MFFDWWLNKLIGFWMMVFLGFSNSFLCCIGFKVEEFFDLVEWIGVGCCYFWKVDDWNGEGGCVEWCFDGVSVYMCGFDVLVG